MERLSENPRDLLIAPRQLRAAEARIDTKNYVNLYHQTFPGRFDVFLEIDAAQTLARLLRAKENGEAGPVFVSNSRFNATGRDVVTLLIRMGIPGQFSIYIGNEDAQRLAGELETAAKKLGG
ncbi:MAG TPA: hypothetical protein VH591_21440 [Ktedonobacterales bacterium]|jgi:hypothetical protein